MRLTKIRPLGDEINENKKISPVLRTNILKKKRSNGSFICIKYILMGLHMETKVQGPFIYCISDLMHGHGKC
jgi:hypothetical protein